MTLPADWEDGQTFTADGENTVSAAVNALMLCTVTGSSVTLSTDTAAYVFNGSAAATWTLPSVAGNANEVFTLYNRGTAVVTVACAGTDKIFAAGGVVATISLPPSSVLIMLNDGSYWLSTAN